MSRSVRWRRKAGAAQIRWFAGTALELQSADGRILVLSTTALEALDLGQIGAIRESAELVALDIPTIQMAGGSVRRTLAGIHLPARG